MEFDNNKTEWADLPEEKKKHQLFLNQKALLDQFLKTGAITKAQHDKSLGDLVKKMGETEEQDG